jgi:hypothetical protein
VQPAAQCDGSISCTTLSSERAWLSVIRHDFTL